MAYPHTPEAKLTAGEAEILETARDLLAPPEAFCAPTALARDASGASVPPTSEEAVCWSLIGALRLAIELLHSHGGLATSSLCLSLVIKLRKLSLVNMAAKTHKEALETINTLLSLPREGESQT